MAFNKVYVNGVLRLGKDVEVSHLPDGSEVVKISGYVNGGKRDSDFWISVTYFGQTGKALKNLVKGSIVAYQGTLNQPSTSLNQNGETTVWTNVTATTWPEKVVWEEQDDNSDNDSYDNDGPGSYSEDDEIPF